MLLLLLLLLLKKKKMMMMMMMMLKAVYLKTIPQSSAMAPTFTPAALRSPSFSRCVTIFHLILATPVPPPTHAPPAQVFLTLGRPRDAADAAAAAASGGGGSGPEPPRHPKELLAAIKSKCASPADAAYVDNLLRSIT